MRELGGCAGHASKQGRELPVQPGPLPWQQVAVDRLAQQRVPEGVAVGAVRHQQLVRDRLPDRLVVGRVGQPGGGADQVVARPPPGHRRRPQHLLGGVRYPLDPGHQQRREPRGEPGPVPGAVGRVRQRGQQLLGVVGVALGAGHDLVDGGGRQAAGCVGDGEQELGQGRRGERAELHRRHRGEPEQVRHDRPERVAAVQVVGPVGADDRDPLAVQHPQQEGEQVAGGRVGPVQVLEDEQHRAAGRQLGQQAEHGAEHLLAGQPGPIGLRVAARAAVGQQPGEDRARLHRRLDFRRRGSDRVREREVGHAVADLGALAAQHREPLTGGDAGHLGDQPGLADPGVAADQGGDGAGGRVIEQGAEPGELCASAYQGRHGYDYPSSGPMPRIN